MKFLMTGLLILISASVQAARIYEIEMLVFQHQADPFSQDETFGRGSVPEPRLARTLGLDAALVNGFVTLDLIRWLSVI